VGGRVIVPSASAGSGTLFGLSGGQLRRIGVAVLVVGFVLFLIGAVLPFLAIQGVMQDPFDPGAIGRVGGLFVFSFILSVIGIILIVIGGIALRFGMIRPVSGYLATEAAPAIQTAAAAVGGGLRDVGFGAPAAPSRDVRIKCRNCGYLETEDAEFCSKCGQRL
jgi:hypothetical protein